MIDCYACQLTDGEKPLPGGSIMSTDLWIIEHCTGPLGVGTLVLKPLRHCTGLWELTEPESRELGPLIKLATATIKNLTNADQIFSSLWSFSDGQPGHIHFVLQPVSRTDRDRVGRSGPFIQTATFEENKTPDVEAVAEFCDRAREWLVVHGNFGESS